jgi:hypothetical protein
MMLKSENDKLLGRIAEIRDELYNARHEKTRSDVNLKLALERVCIKTNKFNYFICCCFFLFRMKNFNMI